MAPMPAPTNSFCKSGLAEKRWPARRGRREDGGAKLDRGVEGAGSAVTPKDWQEVLQPGGPRRHAPDGRIRRRQLWATCRASTPDVTTYTL